MKNFYKYSCFFLVSTVSSIWNSTQLYGSENNDIKYIKPVETLISSLRSFSPETYTVTIDGGPDGVLDIEGQRPQADHSFSFTTKDGTSQSSIEFAGYTWNVKSGTGGPGPNSWSNSDNSVWVDDEGKLHLTIRYINGEWACSEIWSEESFGYGRYTFKVNTNVEELDANSVVGLFTYLDDNNEIDIEFSRWGNARAPVGNYVVQPASLSGNHETFDLNLTGNYSTHRFEWMPHRISYSSWHGHADNPSDSTTIKEWDYTNSDYIPEEGAEKVHLNFWLMNGLPPLSEDVSEMEVVISDFHYMELPLGRRGSTVFVLGATPVKGPPD